MEKVFEINRNFRNEGISLMHNPEFTMIEFYELYRDFNDYMDLTEELLLALGRELLPDDVIQLAGAEQIPVTPPFKRVKFMEAIAEKSGLTAEQLWDEASGQGAISRTHFPEEPLPPTFGKMLELLFDHYVEKTLVEPTFVTYYPKAISPLSKASRLDERETERFELFIAGMEIANGFSELNDPLEQRRRFEAQVRDRERGDDEAQLIDNNFLQALEYGMAPAAGEGIGIDRLVMLYTGAASIKEVILFPLLRPGNEVRLVHRRRYLTKGRKNSFISIISLVSILGIAIGVAALIIALSLINGFQGDIRDRILSSSAHIMITDRFSEGFAGFRRGEPRAWKRSSRR